MHDCYRGYELRRIPQNVRLSFKKIQALLTVWGVADIKKLEEVLQLHVDIVI